jgi:hypothetical protein
MKPCLLALGIQTALPITLQGRHDAASGGVVKSKKAGSLAPTGLEVKTTQPFIVSRKRNGSFLLQAGGMGFASRRESDFVLR